MTSYDQVAYTSLPYEDTTPEYLNILGRLFGFRAPDIQTARVLELGCASGGNLLPLAALYPGAEFVGVDISTGQVQTGSRNIEALGLVNLKLHCCSIEDVDESFGSFDYIVAHGLMSWLPAHLQSTLLTLSGERLSENGLAYISYNTRPGWNNVSTVRDLMLFHTQGHESPEVKIRHARGILSLMAESSTGGHHNHLQVYASENQRVSGMLDDYVLHEFLEANNIPLYFHELVEAADTAGLRYLGDTDLSMMRRDDLPSPIGDQLAHAPDPIRAEQYIDFLRDRRFRKSVLCRKGQRVALRLDPKATRELYVSCPPPGDATYTTSATGTLTINWQRFQVETDNPLIVQIVQTLVGISPSTRRLDELTRDAAALLGVPLAEAMAQVTADPVFEELLLTRILRLNLLAQPYSSSVSDRPVAFAPARLLAQETDLVPNMRHQIVKLSSAGKQVIRLLDGSRTLADAEQALLERVRSGALALDSSEPPESIVHTAVHEAVEECRQRALLVG